ncbi:MAG: tetratricopeptide repeat protein, partial [Candidatus Hodarchaeales archaeon]
MSDLVSKKLALAKELISKGQYEEVLQHIKDIEKMENLTPDEELKTLFYKGRIYYYFDQPDISLKIAEELYQKSQKMRLPLFSMDAFFLKESVFHLQEYPILTEEFYKRVEQHENLFNSIPREESVEFQEREACLLFWKGVRDYHEHNLDLSLENYEKSIEILKRVDPHSYFKSAVLMGMAYTYKDKGELNLGLECAEKGLSLIPDGDYFGLLNNKKASYGIMGQIYYQKGDLTLALECYIRILDIQKKEDKSGVGVIYFSIIDTLLAKKDFNQARNYLQELKELKEKHQSRVSNLIYQGAHALILKCSPRMRDHIEAENILKKIIEDSQDLLRGFIQEYT